MTAKRIDRLHNSFLCLRRERERERRCRSASVGLWAQWVSGQAIFPSDTIAVHASVVSKYNYPYSRQEKHSAGTKPQREREIYIYSYCTSNRLLSRNPSLRKQAIAVLSRPSLYIGYIYIYSLQIYLYRTDRRVFIPATNRAILIVTDALFNLLSPSIYTTLLISTGASFMTEH